MQVYYNMNQLSLAIPTYYEPETTNTAWYINELVESLEISESYLFGRPREYDLSAMLKLVLFAYTRSVFSSRRIQQFAEENMPARWLTQEMVPSYRTIARFRISADLETLIETGLDQLVDYLRQRHMIDEVTFIDGTKILADANKFSFVWKKNTIRFDKMNRETIIELLGELKSAQVACHIPDGTNLNLEMLDEVVTRMEFQLEKLETEIDATPKLSPHPAKKARRTLKSKKRKLTERRNKMAEHQAQMGIYGDRNSYSKTDHDATFMRVKEDPMLNGQLKPAYNVQFATTNQFITGFGVFQRPTDTRTFIPFLKDQLANGRLGKYIVADAGYGSESNYRFIEDELPEHTALIPYGTMLKENSRKWQSDDKKVMNWDYHEKDDYFNDPKNVRFNFTAYRKRTDKYGMTRDFKEYQAEKYDENHELIEAALTPGGNIRKISINESWEYYKAQQRERLSTKETGKIYARRKIDVEPVFGRMKACLHFTRFSVRGLTKVKRETGIMVIALNMVKLAAMGTKFDLNIAKYK
jgi:transposase